MTEDGPGGIAVRAGREQVIAETFVRLADSLVADYDVVDVLDQLVAACVDILTATSAGMLLDDQRGGLAVAAASDDETRTLEVFQIQHAQGPCPDCIATGEAVVSADLERDRDRWPDFVPVALSTSHAAVLAVPLRLRGEVVGALGLFRAAPGEFSEGDRYLAQAFADVATIGILQHRTVHRSTMMAEQLQLALDSRIVVEQAKGVLAERRGISVTEAFTQLRGHARNHNLKLTAVAAAVVNGDLSVADV